MHRKISITICLSVLVFVGIAYSQTSDVAVVDRFISRQATTENGEEYGEARKTLRGDVNGDRKIDLVVLYTLEGFDGGNDHRQYIAVFLGNGKGFRYAADAVVGGKFSRSVELRSVTGGKIHLSTLEYTKKDPACCPSRKSKALFVFANGKLREIK